MQNIALDDAPTNFPVKAIPNYYDYSFKNKLSHRVNLWNYTGTTRIPPRYVPYSYFVELHRLWQRHSAVD